MDVFIKRNLVILSMVAILFGTFFIGTNRVYAASGDTVVYITKTGECYHSGGCSSLRKSKIETTLQSAIDRGYRACSKCKPGILDASSDALTNSKVSASAITKTTVVVNAATDTIEDLKTYKGNTKEFNAYTYYISNTDLQLAIGPDGDKLLKHFNDYGKAEGRKAN